MSEGTSYSRTTGTTIVISGETNSKVADDDTPMSCGFVRLEQWKWTGRNLTVTDDGENKSDSSPNNPKFYLLLPLHELLFCYAATIIYLCFHLMGIATTSFTSSGAGRRMLLDSVLRQLLAVASYRRRAWWSRERTTAVLACAPKEQQRSTFAKMLNDFCTIFSCLVANSNI